MKRAVLEWRERVRYRDEERQAVDVRQVRIADLDACAWIEETCYEGHGASRARIERRIREYPEGFWVAVSGSRVTGFINSGCILRDDISDEQLKDLVGHDPEGRNSVIFSLAVQPEFQGRGIARSLLERFIRESRESGMHSILLICREELMLFYNRFGFVYRAPSRATYAGVPWHEMALDLS